MRERGSDARPKEGCSDPRFETFGVIVRVLGKMAAKHALCTKFALVQERHGRAAHGGVGSNVLRCSRGMPRSGSAHREPVSALDIFPVEHQELGCVKPERGVRACVNWQRGMPRVVGGDAASLGAHRCRAAAGQATTTAAPSMDGVLA